MKKLLQMTLALLSGAVQAAPSLLGAESRAVPGTSLSAAVGTHSLGLSGSLQFPSGGGSHEWLRATAVHAPGDRVSQLELLYGRELVHWPVFGLAVQLGADLSAVLGPADVGLGPLVGITAGWHWTHVGLELGLQAQAEGFVASPGIRLPLRMVLGFSIPLGNLALGAAGGAGVDVERGLALTYRYEALGFLRYQLPLIF